jgi:hypothetical protein
VPSVSPAVLQVPRSGGEESMVDQGKAVGEDRIDRELTEAGWLTDGSFSEHPAIGNSGDLCVLVHRKLGRPTSPPTNSTMWGDTSPTGCMRSPHPTEPPRCGGTREASRGGVSACTIVVG